MSITIECVVVSIVIRSIRNRWNSTKSRLAWKWNFLLLSKGRKEKRVYSFLAPYQLCVYVKTTMFVLSCRLIQSISNTQCYNTRIIQVSRSCALKGQRIVTVTKNLSSDRCNRRPCVFPLLTRRQQEPAVYEKRKINATVCVRNLDRKRRNRKADRKVQLVSTARETFVWISYGTIFRGSRAFSIRLSFDRALSTI